MSDDRTNGRVDEAVLALFYFGIFERYPMRTFANKVYLTPLPAGARISRVTHPIAAIDRRTWPVSCRW